MYKKYTKRIIDIIIGLLSLIILWPLFIIVAAAIKLESEGPILFIQDRIGKNGIKFKMYKFRSMYLNTEFKGSGVYSDRNDNRVTTVGKIIRDTSIDELPQLLNILKGDMSLIGPRPPLLYHPWKLEEYSDEERRMFEVRPGISGWAQINGRKQVEWHERIKLNIWYVDNMSFLLDLKIFFLTFYKVLINANNSNDGSTV